MLSVLLKYSLLTKAGNIKHNFMHAIIPARFDSFKSFSTLSKRIQKAP